MQRNSSARAVTGAVKGTVIGAITGIVPRLRIVLFSISVVLVSAGSVGFAQLQEIGQSVSRLTGSTVTTFVQTEKMERDLKNLLILLQRVDGVTSVEKLEPLLESVQVQMALLRQNTFALKGLGQSITFSEIIAEAIEKIETGAINTLNAKEISLLHEEKLAALQSSLRTSLETVARLLEDLTYQITSLGGEQFQFQGSETLLSLEQIEHVYAQNLLWAHMSTSISLELRTVISSALAVLNLDHLGEIATSEAELRYKMRNLVQMIGQLPATEIRTELAAEVMQIRAHLIGTQGVITEVAKLMESRRQLANHIVGNRAPIEQISTVAANLTQDARLRIEAARQNLTEVTREMIIVFIIATVLSLIAIGFALVFIVERQISRRMARLTKAVLAIADGEQEYPVKVAGPDELGKMAGALDVFKVNAAELQRSNAELEKFAYVAAHDLRSPLHAIQDLATWTLEDEDTQLSPDSKENMRLLQKRIKRLNRLLGDLLEYSRVGMEKEDITQLSLHQIVRETGDMLDPERHYNIAFQGGADFVRTYETPLRHILLNLINNSIKHHDRDRGNISVSSEVIGGRLHCVVSDDGPGIEPKYHNRVFGLFQTLRPRDDVEGSGLGLAIIAKQMKHYDGKIELRSDPSLKRGTSFLFDLPEKSIVQLQTKRAA